MIEDVSHLAAMDAMMRQLQDNLIHYNRLANGITEKVALYELRLKQNAELVEILRQQKRGMDWYLGRPIEPETHVAEAVMVAVGSGTMQ
jgi:hypothetical protein